jgi:hypothetical protein
MKRPILTGGVLLEAGAGGSVQEQYTISDFDSRFSPVINSSDIFISDIFEMNGNWYFSITAPIKTGGSKYWLAGVTIQTEIFKQIEHDAREFKGSILTILTNTSKFVIHQNRAFIGHTLVENFPDEPQLVEAQLKIAQGTIFNLTTTSKNEEYYSVFCANQNYGYNEALDDGGYCSMHEVMIDTIKSIRNSILFAILGNILLVIIISW